MKGLLCISDDDNILTKLLELKARLSVSFELKNLSEYKIII